MSNQKCEDTGPLTRKRMEPVDEEVTAGSLKFIEKAVKDSKLGSVRGDRESQGKQLTMP